MSLINNILFPVDFSDRSKAAAPFVLSMAQRYKAKVVLLHAFEPPPPLYGGMNTVYPVDYDFSAIEVEMRVRLLDFAKEQLPKVDVVCVTETGFPAPVITRYAEEHGIDLIAMPTHGYGPFRRALLGSVTAKVLHDAIVPVWTDAHTAEPSHRAHPQPRHIIAALDLKPESKKTLEYALQLARDAGATVEIVHAAPEGEITAMQSENKLQEVIADAARESLIGVQKEVGADEAEIVVDAGSVPKLLHSVATKRRTDVIVIGRGAIQEGIARLRSNAYGVVREAPCPVISV